MGHNTSNTQPWKNTTPRASMFLCEWWDSSLMDTSSTAFLHIQLQSVCHRNPQTVKKLQKHGVFFFFSLSTSHLLPVNVEHNPLCRKSNKQNCKASVLQLDPSPWQRVNLSHGKQLGIDSISFLYCASQPVHSFQPKSKKIGGKRKVKEFCIRRGSGSKRGKWSLPQCYHDHILQVSSPALPLLN